jgi:hypothetical protein
MSTGKVRSESTEQTIFVARVRQFHPDVVLMSIPNGGKRDPRVAAQMKREGVLAGAPDLFLAEARNGSHGLFIEMKRLKGKTSKDQDMVIDRLKQRGYSVVVAEGADAAHTAFLEYAYGPEWLKTFPHFAKLAYNATTHTKETK